MVTPLRLELGRLKLRAQFSKIGQIGLKHELGAAFLKLLICASQQALRITNAQVCLFHVKKLSLIFLKHSSACYFYRLM